MIKERQKFVLSSVLFLSKNAGIKLMETLIITEKVTVLADGDQVVFKIKTSGGYYKYVRRNVADIKRIIFQCYLTQYPHLSQLFPSVNR